MLAYYEAWNKWADFWMICQVNINPKISTVEELQSKRKTLHLGNAALIRRDLVLQAKSGLRSYLEVRGKAGCNSLEVLCGLPEQVSIDHITNTIQFIEGSVSVTQFFYDRLV